MDQNNIYCPSTAPSPLPMRRNSKTISKTKPKIRIIHIFAPQIIQTDATNFRELVQRLTGKPTAADGGAKAKSRKKEGRIFRSSKNKKMEMGVRGGALHAEFRAREEDIWRNANSGGGFLGGFAEFDGVFMQEINHLPFLETQNQMQDVYGPSMITSKIH